MTYDLRVIITRVMGKGIVMENLNSYLPRGYSLITLIQVIRQKWVNISELE